MSRLAVSLASFRTRLAGIPLPPGHAKFVASYLRSHHRDGDVLLWLDEPWTEIEWDELACDGPVSLAVFEAPTITEGALVLSNERLLDDPIARDDSFYLFLGPVRCRDIVTLPDTNAVFSGGLEVDRLACLLAGDATTFVAKQLRASILVSECSISSLNLAPGTDRSVTHDIRDHEALERACEGVLEPLGALVDFDDSGTNAFWEAALALADDEVSLA